MKNWLDKFEGDEVLDGNNPSGKVTPKKKRVLVVAEAPVDTLVSYGIQTDDPNMPSELQKIREDYWKALEEYDSNYKEYDESIARARNEVIGYFDTNADKDSEEYQNYSNALQDVSNYNFDSPLLEGIVNKNTLLELKKNFDLRKNSMQKQMDLYDSFYDNPLNPVNIIQEKAFITEGNNVKTFYKNNPNVEVEILPLYEDKELLQSKLSALNEDDDVLIFGHSGSQFAGIDNKEISEYLNKSKSKNVYLGTCNGGTCIDGFSSVKDKNIYYREEGPWYGFNPKSKTFMDGMFSRNTDPNNRSNVVINPAKENVNYKVNKQKYGGIIKTQGGVTKSKLHTLNMNPLYEQAVDNTRNIEAHQVGMFNRQGELAEGDFREYQEGGTIPKAQNGLVENKYSELPQYVFSNTPEYRKLYEEGRVGRYNPTTDTYTLPDLEGVEIKSIDQSVAKAVRDSGGQFWGGVGELMSQPQRRMMEGITGKEQYPSEAIGFKDPKGFWQNAANFGIDALTDPIDLVGIGVAGKFGIKGVNSIAKAVKNLNFRKVPELATEVVETVYKNPPIKSQGIYSTVPTNKYTFSPNLDEYPKEISKVYKESTPNSLFPEEGIAEYPISKKLAVDLTNFYENSPFVMQSRIQRLQKIRNEIADQLSTLKLFEQIKYSGSPFKRDKNFYALSQLDFSKDGKREALREIDNVLTKLQQKRVLPDEVLRYASEDELRVIREYDMKRIQNGEYDLLFEPPFDTERTLFGESDLGRYYHSAAPSKLRGNAYLSRTNNPEQTLSTGLHELGHKTTREYNYFTRPEQSQIESIFDLSGVDKESAARLSNLMNYDEIIADIKPLRAAMKDYDGSLVYTKEILDNFFMKDKNSKFPSRLKMIYDKGILDTERLSDVLNTFKSATPYIIPSTIGAYQIIDKKQNGGKISREGIVKDNNGYWNPDNWGKPVEIDSNHITMKGVNQPLMGISDTGHTQMMYPGQDYHFEGNRVTELPMAQKGITLSGPTIRGKKYPKGTVVTGNLAQYQANQDSLNLYNRGKNLHEKEMQAALQRSLKVYDMIQSSPDISEEEKKNFSKPQRSHYRDYLMGDISGYTPDGYSDEVINLMNSNPNIKPQGFFSGEGYAYGAFYKKPTNMVFEDKINKMTSKGFPQPVVTPNQGIRPDVIYTERPDGHYKQGLSISHRTDPLGRWAADIHPTSYPGIKGSLTSFPEGVHNVEYKYQDEGWLSKYD